MSSKSLSGSAQNITVNFSGDYNSISSEDISTTNLSTTNLTATNITGTNLTATTTSITTLTLSGLTGASPLKINASELVIASKIDLTSSSDISNTPANGNLLIGNGTTFTIASLTGTSNQINISNSAGGITLSLPQSIHTGASPTFTGLNLSGLTASKLIRTDASKNLVSGTIDLTSASDISNAPSNGYIPIGNGTNFVLAGITGTTNQVNVSNGSGSITLSLPQNIHTSATPTFSQITVGGTKINDATNLKIENTTSGIFSLFQSTTGLTSLNSGVGQPLRFKIDNITQASIESSGAINLPNLTASLPLKLDSSKNIVSSKIDITSDMSNTPSSGQIPIGTGTAFSLATITGTSNQVNITNGAGSITLSTPQSIATSSSPTFTGLNLSGLTASRPVKTDASKNLVSAKIDLTSTNDITNTPTNGQLLIGNSTNFVLSNLTGTTNQVNITNSAGGITLSTPQNINTNASVQFNNITFGSNDNLLIGGAKFETLYTNNNLYAFGIGNTGLTTNTFGLYGKAVYGGGSNYVITDGCAFFNQTSNEDNATCLLHLTKDTRIGINKINPSYTLDVNGVIASNSTTNQIVLGTTNTTTLSATAPSSSRIYTIPDTGANSSFVMTDGIQTINGDKSFTGNIDIEDIYVYSLLESFDLYITSSADIYNLLVFGYFNIYGTSFVLNSGATGKTTITTVTNSSARNYTLQDAGVDANFILSESNQTINGVKTFSSNVKITPTTNQLVLGTTNTTTISASAPSSSRTYTIPDTGANSSFVMTDGTQTLNGVKTFNDDISMNTSQVIFDNSSYLNFTYGQTLQIVWHEFKINTGTFDTGTTYKYKPYSSNASGMLYTSTDSSETTNLGTRTLGAFIASTIITQSIFSLSAYTSTANPRLTYNNFDNANTYISWDTATSITRLYFKVNTSGMDRIKVCFLLN